MLRWLLQVDKPVPPRSDEDIAAEVARNYRWNFGVNLLDGASFLFVLSSAPSSTIVPLFISKLTASPLPIGLAAVIAQGGWFLPQLFTANCVEQLARKKPVVIDLGFFLERLPMWALVIAALIAGRAPATALALFLACFAQFWATLPEILRRDNNFRRFLLARLLLALGGMGVGSVTVAAVQRWQVPDSTVGAYTAALLLGQTVGNLAFGWLADRFGHKLSLELGALASFLAFALAWLAPSAEWYYAVFTLLGITPGCDHRFGYCSRDRK